MSGGCAPGLEQKRHVGKIRGSDVYYRPGSCGGVGIENADGISVVAVNGGLRHLESTALENDFAFLPFV